MLIVDVDSNQKKMIWWSIATVEVDTHSKK